MVGDLLDGTRKEPAVADACRLALRALALGAARDRLCAIAGVPDGPMRQPQREYPLSWREPARAAVVDAGYLPASGEWAELLYWTGQFDRARELLRETLAGFDGADSAASVTHAGVPWRTETEKLMLAVLETGSTGRKLGRAEAHFRADVLVALVTHRPEAIDHSQRAQMVLRELLEAIDDWPENSDEYRRALRALPSGPARDELCEEALKTYLPRHQEALAAALEAGHLPTEPQDQLEFLVSTDQWERVKKMSSWSLRDAYTSAYPWQAWKIRQAATRSGHLDLLPEARGDEVSIQEYSRRPRNDETRPVGSWHTSFGYGDGYGGPGTF